MEFNIECLRSCYQNIKLVGCLKHSKLKRKRKIHSLRSKEQHTGPSRGSQPSAIQNGWIEPLCFRANQFKAASATWVASQNQPQRLWGSGTHTPLRQSLLPAHGQSNWSGTCSQRHLVLACSHRELHDCIGREHHSTKVHRTKSRTQHQGHWAMQRWTQACILQTSVKRFIWKTVDRLCFETTYCQHYKSYTCGSETFSRKCLLGEALNKTTSTLATGGVLGKTYLILYYFHYLFLPD